jgi:Ca-activated chloride channel family protein
VSETKLDFDADDQRLSAFALGELEGTEHAAEKRAVEGILARSAAARRFVDELRAAGAALQSELISEPAEALAPGQRAAIEARLAAERAPAPARGKILRFRPAYLAAAAAGVLAVGFAAYQVYVGRGAKNDAGAPGSTLVARLEGSGAKPAGSATEMRAKAVDGLHDIGYMTEADDDESQPDWNREGYAAIDENGFAPAVAGEFSTFSIDVDTASYANVRRFLASGQLPPPGAVRIEELVNYFPYDMQPPIDGRPFSVVTEVASAPWAPAHRLVRIGLMGRVIDWRERKPLNLVFLIDVSGSMDQPDKLPLLQRSLRLLVEQLQPADQVALVVYAGAAGMVLPPTGASSSAAILAAIDQLQAGGSTAGGAGIQLAYATAEQAFDPAAVNRVVLCTDGDFNVGVSDDSSLAKLIEEKRKTGVFLSVLGFGTGNVQDAKMEMLADKGNGNYAYVDTLDEARKVLVEEMGGTLVPIAKDVKIQVEFNPKAVQAWRLIGYENRLLAAQDFNDDTKDAGEIGAGVAVTALYEVVPVGVAYEGPTIDPSRYAAPADAAAAYSGELMHLKLRYKEPASDTSTLIETPIHDARLTFPEASEDLRWAASVAGFGMVLRGSQHCGNWRMADVLGAALQARGHDQRGYRGEFLALVGKAQALGK